jgi:hypothetical protein
MDYENITGFVSYGYDCKWWLGHALCTERETDTVKTVFLHSNGTQMLYT